jgi:AcrR family transcriptional regulator
VIEFQLPENLRPPSLGPSRSELTDRGREILDQLGYVFVEQGFMHLTISDLATLMQCSRRTLYELAPNRTELVLVAIDRRLRRIGRVAADYLKTIDEPFELLTRFMLAGQSEIHLASPRFSEDVARSPAVARLVSSYLRYHVAIVRSILDYGIERGAFRPVNTRVVAEMIDGAFAKFNQSDFLRESQMTFEDATEELVDLLRHGLRPQPDEMRKPARQRAPRRTSKPAVAAQAATPGRTQQAKAEPNRRRRAATNS